VPDPLAARRAERAELIARAAAYVDRLRPSLDLVAAAVAGSVARGDFNVWSDVDVVVVAPGLPERAVDRAGLLLEHAPARVQPVGYTPDEFAAAVRRGDRLACEAKDRGVVLAGGEFFGRAQDPRPIHSSPPS
jgi:uncharacterized protein